MIWNTIMEMSHLKNEVNDEEVSNYDKSKNKVKDGWFHTEIKKKHQYLETDEKEVGHHIQRNHTDL